jgi:glycogen debranching enzyme
MNKANDEHIYVDREDAYYIPISTSYIDDRVLILNSGDTFGIFNKQGDLQHAGNDASGLYHHGTRFLQSFELRINGHRPVLLSSAIRDNNEVLTVDLINPALTLDDEHIIPQGRFHILRSKFIKDDICYESLCLESYDSFPKALDLTFSLLSDFKDIFEVRGMDRSRRGKYLGPTVVDSTTIELGYSGLDGTKRICEVRFSAPFTQFDGETIMFRVPLVDTRRCELDVEIHFHHVADGEEITSRSFGDAEKNALEVLLKRNDQFALVETSNQQFNHWIHRSQADLISLIADTEYGQYPYAGVPWFNTPFGRDGLITAQQTLWLAPEIAKGVLTYTAKRQATSVDDFTEAEPGKIFHETRRGEITTLHELPFGIYYGTIDATPLFVSLAGHYYRRTGDKEMIAAIWPNIKAGINWIEQYGDFDGDGFVEYIHKSEKGLTNQGWKDSYDSVFHNTGALAEAPIALCEVQGYVYDAYVQGAYLAEELGEMDLAGKLSQAASTLQTNFNNVFWDEELKTFVIALDRDKKPCRIKTSNAGHCLFSGIASTQLAEQMIPGLFGADMYSGWGIRTLSADSQRYNPMSYHNGSIWPHDNSLIALGLNRYGFKNEALTVLQGLFNASLRFTGQRLPELFCGFPQRAGEGPTHYPVACSPQAWAVATSFACVQAAIGLTIDAKTCVLDFYRPALPPWLNSLTVRGLQLGKSHCDLFLNRYEDDVGLSIRGKPDNWSVIIRK